ncbi:hypothetical protein SISSUDRAFT_1037989, partial [Sistotremastrum suecicum HHB10207 ss-3]
MAYELSYTRGARSPSESSDNPFLSDTHTPYPRYTSSRQPNAAFTSSSDTTVAMPPPLTNPKSTTTLIPSITNLQESSQQSPNDDSLHIKFAIATPHWCNPSPAHGDSSYRGASQNILSFSQADTNEDDDDESTNSHSLAATSLSVYSPAVQLIVDMVGSLPIGSTLPLYLWSLQPVIPLSHSPRNPSLPLRPEIDVRNIKHLNALFTGLMAKLDDAVETTKSSPPSNFSFEKMRKFAIEPHVDALILLGLIDRISLTTPAWETPRELYQLGDLEVNVDKRVYKQWIYPVSDWKSTHLDGALWRQRDEWYQRLSTAFPNYRSTSLRPPTAQKHDDNVLESIVDCIIQYQGQYQVVSNIGFAALGLVWFSQPDGKARKKFLERLNELGEEHPDIFDFLQGSSDQIEKKSKSKSKGNAGNSGQARSSTLTSTKFIKPCLFALSLGANILLKPMLLTSNRTPIREILMNYFVQDYIPSYWEQVLENYMWWTIIHVATCGSRDLDAHLEVLRELAGKIPDPQKHSSPLLQSRNVLFTCQTQTQQKPTRENAPDETISESGPVISQVLVAKQAQNSNETPLQNQVPHLNLVSSAVDTITLPTQVSLSSPSDQPPPPLFSHKLLASMPSEQIPSQAQHSSDPRPRLSNSLALPDQPPNTDKHSGPLLQIPPNDPPAPSSTPTPPPEQPASTQGLAGPLTNTVSVEIQQTDVNSDNRHENEPEIEKEGVERRQGMEGENSDKEMTDQTCTKACGTGQGRVQETADTARSSELDVDAPTSFSTGIHSLSAGHNSQAPAQDNPNKRKRTESGSSSNISGESSSTESSLHLDDFVPSVQEWSGWHDELKCGVETTGNQCPPMHPLKREKWHTLRLRLHSEEDMHDELMFGRDGQCVERFWNSEFVYVESTRQDSKIVKWMVKNLAHMKDTDYAPYENVDQPLTDSPLDKIGLLAYTSLTWKNLREKTPRIAGHVLENNVV